MTKGQKERIATLSALLDAQDREILHGVADLLDDMGYAPRREKAQDNVLSFTHKQANVAIAKVGRWEDGPGPASFRFKYSAADALPRKFSDAVQNEVIANDGKNAWPKEPVPGVDPRLCGPEHNCATRMAYAVTLPDGRSGQRCSAYAVEVPGLTLDDMPDIRRILSQQHARMMDVWAAKKTRDDDA